MGLVQNLRGSRTESTHEGLPVSSVQSGLLPKRKCSNLMPLVVALVVIAEIAFLGRLDMAENAAMVTDFFYRSRAASVVDGADDLDFGLLVGRTNKKNSESESCEEWLEREDSVTYERDFNKEPVYVTGADQEWKSCAVGCKFGYDGDRTPDAAFGLPQPSGTASVLRSMESAQYYSENNLAMARRRFYLHSHSLFQLSTMFGAASKLASAAANTVTDAAQAVGHAGYEVGADASGVVSGAAKTVGHAGYELGADASGVVAGGAKAVGNAGYEVGADVSGVVAGGAKTVGNAGYEAGKVVSGVVAGGAKAVGHAGYEVGADVSGVVAGGAKAVGHAGYEVGRTVTDAVTGGDKTD